MFSNEANGYNKKEVDKKINSMLVELSNLKQSNIEKDKLNLGLATALDKAKQIEESSRNLSELKNQKISIIFKSLEKSFRNLFNLYPQIEEFDDIKSIFNEFSQTIETAIDTSETKQTITSPVSTENDTMRLLLNKMSSYAQPQNFKVVEKKPVSIKRADSRESIREQQPSEKPSMIKPIVNLELSTKDKYDSLADKFLQSDQPTSSVYEKIINTKVNDDMYPTPNESGFDLKEAVNPKDDLTEIMKSFDFNE